MKQYSDIIWGITQPLLDRGWASAEGLQDDGNGNCWIDIYNDDFEASVYVAFACGRLEVTRFQLTVSNSGELNFIIQAPISSAEIIRIATIMIAGMH